ncbi:hypothetical protein CDAR_275211 [Caerostris darwini]|uniref:Uncharacterized protein n=1 Tax=Caerostris darwini TaxID=1538125 RepID=A0AAV4VX91_9ARAC|nr:hypothetical protein CDAR_275211 [Caerostris darwini]
MKELKLTSSRFSLIKTTSGRGVFFLWLREQVIPGRPLICDSRGFTGNDKSLSIFVSRASKPQRQLYQLGNHHNNSYYNSLETTTTTATTTTTWKPSTQQQLLQRLGKRSSFEEDNARKIDIGRDLCRNNEAYIPEDKMAFCVG